MNDLAPFQPAFSGVNTLLAVSTNIETEQITNGNLKLKGNIEKQAPVLLLWAIAWEILNSWPGTIS
jgi:hypothetical protein